MDGWAYLCGTADEMKSTLAQSWTLSTDWCEDCVGFKSSETPISFYQAAVPQKKKRSQFPLGCLSESVTATQASASEDLKAALSHFPAPAQSAKHSFTSTANISSASMRHLTVFSQSFREPGLLGPPPGSRCWLVL